MSLQDKKSYLGLAQIYNCLGTTHATETIENILKHEIDINIKAPTQCGWAIDNPKLLGSTALHLAVVKKDFNSFKLLLDCGADFTIKNNQGFTVLQCILEKYFKEPDNFCSSVAEDEFVKSLISACVQSEYFSKTYFDDNGMSYFHIACITNHSEAIEFFVKNGAPVDLPVGLKYEFIAGWKPLHFAARSYSTESIRALLTNKANRASKNDCDMTASDLLVSRRLELLGSSLVVGNKKYSADAIKAENEKIEETLRLLVDFSLEEGEISIDEATFNAISTLQDPSKCRSFPARFLNYGYRKTSPTWTKLTAIHLAACCNVETMKLLICSNYKVTHCNNDTLTSPVEYLMRYERCENVAAVLNFETELQDIVFSHGDDARVSDLILSMRDADEFYAYLRHTLVNINRRVSKKSPLFKGYTALHLAVHMSERFKVDEPALTLIELCLKRGADVTVRDIRDQTPIHLAFRQNKPKTANLLLSHEHSLTNPTDKDGLSHLHIACAVNNVGFVRSLVGRADLGAVCRSKIDTCKPIKLGYTPLHVAVDREHSEIVELLVNAGANVNARDHEGWTPIHRAFGLPGAKNIVDALLATESLENHWVYNTGLSHLHVACSVDNVEAVNKLLVLGADINAPIVYRADETEACIKEFANLRPMDIAYKEKLPRMMELLLQRGAELLAKHSAGSYVLVSMLTAKQYGTLFASKFWADEQLQKRLLTAEGLSTLHIACYTFDLARIADILKSDDVNVNARMPKSTFFGNGRTPLHLFLFKAASGSMRDYEPTLRLLLDKGADVTIADGDGYTPIHVYEANGTDRTHLRLLLDYHRDFSKNPTNLDGLSHFHFACEANHVEIIRKFLESGLVKDVNRPMGAFYNSPRTGCSLIDLAVCAQTRELYGIQSQVETIELLLKHKADPRVEDVRGSTVFHSVARSESPRVQILEKFAEYGVYSNHQNFKGETPFEALLKSRNVLIEEIDFFLKHNCQANSFNPVNGEGYMSMLMSKKYHNTQQEEAFGRMIAASKECLRDEAGRTVIHNIVSCNEVLISVDKYMELIDEFAKWGVDVDERDEFGATALHVAAHFGNSKATQALLWAGADVNITDADDKSGFSRAIESTAKSSSREKVIKRLAYHVYKLQYLNLNVSQLNVSLLKDNTPNVDLSFKLDLMECVSAKRNSIDLGGFLSETGTVARYCMMMTWERKRIDRYFETFHKETDLMQLKDVLKLQYRKAVTRLRLKVPWVRTVEESFDWKMPNVPCRTIVRCMSNADLKELTAIKCGEDEAVDDEMMVIDID